MSTSFGLPARWRVGDTLQQISTPALVLNLDTFDENVAQMAALAGQHGVALRPHAKAHKCSTIALKQMTQGAVGVCCQKLSEAYPFAAHGINSIHISNEFFGADKLIMAVDLAQRVKLSVCVDHVAQIAAIGTAATEAGVHITVFPEIDAGQGRCGVAQPEALMTLVEAIAQHSSLSLGGLQSFHGGVQHKPDWNERREGSLKSAEFTARFVQFLEARGIPCPVVTGGGTGSAEFDVACGVYTEIQPGSYIFMDGHYSANRGPGNEGQAPNRGLPSIGSTPRNSLFILSTIMSTSKPGRAVCDLGLKGVSVDSGLPKVRAEDKLAELRYITANDEHGILELPAGFTSDLLGERLLLVPGHCDPTANLYQQYVGYRNGVVECLWDIDARGLSQ
jgi:D-serine deaminase-like pyridoxal phosphate-dependent protein